MLYPHQVVNDHLVSGRNLRGRCFKTDTHKTKLHAWLATTEAGEPSMSFVNCHKLYTLHAYSRAWQGEKTFLRNHTATQPSISLLLSYKQVSLCLQPVPLTLSLPSQLHFSSHLLSSLFIPT